MRINFRILGYFWASGELIFGFWGISGHRANYFSDLGVFGELILGFAGITIAWKFIKDLRQALSLIVSLIVVIVKRSNR